MRKIIFILPFCIISNIYSQTFVGQFDVRSFFNNHEFAGSSVKNSQTMAGVRFAPQIGLSFEEKHLAFVGVDVLHEFGSYNPIDNYDIIAYYRFNGKPFDFYMGAFPRKLVLNHYPRMFFQDSVNNYRPVMNGFFWEYRSKKDDYFNVWLDWTGRQSFQTREAFFMGWSGRYNLGLFYCEHFIYMFHYASSMNPSISEPVNDNGLMLTSIGIDLAKIVNFDKLEINAGWSLGLERDRGSNEGWQNPQGFVSELKVEYKGAGLFNTIYFGDGQQVRYNIHKNNLYWGDQAYRVAKYDRADFYYNFIKNNAVSVKLIYSLHFLEKKMFHEQSLYAIFNLDNIFIKKH